MSSGGTIHNIPLSVILSWPTPNYTDPERRAWFPAYGIPFLALSTIVLTARLWCRYRRTAGPLGIDDAVIIVAWVFAVLFTALGVLGTMKYGMDRHVWDNNILAHPTIFVKASLVGWLSEGAFLFSTGATKISVLLFYRRLGFGAYNKVWMWAIYLAIGFTIVYMLAFALYLVFICSPTEAYWKSFDLTYRVNYRCSNERVTNPINGVLSVFSDFYAVLLPGILLWNIQMPKRQKIGLYIIFAFGSLVVGAGIARTVFLHRLANNALVDGTWLSFDVFVWAQLECQLAITCASAPALKVFIAKYLGPPFSRVYQNSKKLSNSMTSTTRSITRTKRTLSVSTRVHQSLGSNNSSKRLAISSPRLVTPQPSFEILDWPSQNCESTRRMNTPTDVDYYDRYLAGKYGPPVPPKDNIL